VDLFPALDIQRGRLARATDSHATDPMAAAQALATQGAAWIHVVDMDRALQTGGDNTDLVCRLCAIDDVAVQVGGNPIDPELVGRYATAGARRVVLGAGVVCDPDRAAACLAAVARHRSAVALEVQDGRLISRSGTDLPLTLSEAIENVTSLGIPRVVYRHLGRDGQLGGLDLTGASAVLGAGVSVIVAGGTATLDELAQARAMGFAGVIVGRALLDGAFTLREALACCG